ncbi:hypothetical protein M3Y98_00124200 [Aphelenchoides besseyi]|nr:hypothetical protein M3Y98_00124200 [Aphelenchoides besseyi]
MTFFSRFLNIFNKQEESKTGHENSQNANRSVAQSTSQMESSNQSNRPSTITATTTVGTTIGTMEESGMMASSSVPLSRCSSVASLAPVSGAPSGNTQVLKQQRRSNASMETITKKRRSKEDQKSKDKKDESRKKHRRSSKPSLVKNEKRHLKQLAARNSGARQAAARKTVEKSDQFAEVDIPPIAIAPALGTQKSRKKPKKLRNQKRSSTQKPVRSQSLSINAINDPPTSSIKPPVMSPKPPSLRRRAPTEVTAASSVDGSEPSANPRLQKTTESTSGFAGAQKNDDQFSREDWDAEEVAMTRDEIQRLIALLTPEMRKHDPTPHDPWADLSILQKRDFTIYSRKQTRLNTAATYAFQVRTIKDSAFQIDFRFPPLHVNRFCRYPGVLVEILNLLAKEANLTIKALTWKDLLPNVQDSVYYKCFNTNAQSRVLKIKSSGLYDKLWSFFDIYNPSVWCALVILWILQWLTCVLVKKCESKVTGKSTISAGETAWLVLRAQILQQQNIKFHFRAGRFTFFAFSALNCMFCLGIFSSFIVANLFKNIPTERTIEDVLNLLQKREFRLVTMNEIALFTSLNSTQMYPFVRLRSIIKANPPRVVRRSEDALQLVVDGKALLFQTFDDPTYAKSNGICHGLTRIESAEMPIFAKHLLLRKESSFTERLNRAIYANRERIRHLVRKYSSYIQNQHDCTQRKVSRPLSELTPQLY